MTMTWLCRSMASSTTQSIAATASTSSGAPLTAVVQSRAAVALGAAQAAAAGELVGERLVLGCRRR
jgi:hypothetical protein